MKRVNFGHKGGFPLEQETLIHLQRAYADDMLSALLGQWGIDPTQNYLIKEASSTEDGWIVTTFAREEINAQTGNAFTVTKPELLRLKFNGAKRPNVEILDLRKSNGVLEYADGQPKRVYEEWVGQYVTSPSDPLNTVITGLIELKSITDLTADIDNVKEDYLLRDGSKPMTGDLNLGPHQMSKLDANESFSANVRSADFNFGYSSRRGLVYPNRPLGRALVDNGDTLSFNYASDWENTAIYGDVTLPNLNQSSSQTPVVIDSSGNIGIATSSIITPQATETVQGKAEIATQGETNGSTDDSRFITPRKLHNRTATTSRTGIAEVATSTEVTDGDFADRYKIVSPYYLRFSNYVQRRLYGGIRFSLGGIGTNSFTVFGNISSAVALNLVGLDSRYRLNFSSSVFGSYVPIAVVESRGTFTNGGGSNFNNENDSFITFANLNSNGLDLIFREVNNPGNVTNQFTGVIIQIIN